MECEPDDVKMKQAEAAKNTDAVLAAKDKQIAVHVARNADLKKDLADAAFFLTASTTAAAKEIDELKAKVANLLLLPARPVLFSGPAMFDRATMSLGSIAPCYGICHRDGSTANNNGGGQRRWSPSIPWRSARRNRWIELCTLPFPK